MKKNIITTLSLLLILFVTININYLSNYLLKFSYDLNKINTILILSQLIFFLFYFKLDNTLSTTNYINLKYLYNLFLILNLIAIFINLINFETFYSFFILSIIIIVDEINTEIFNNPLENGISTLYHQNKIIYL